MAPVATKEEQISRGRASGGPAMRLAGTGYGQMSTTAGLLLYLLGRSAAGCLSGPMYLLGTYCGRWGVDSETKCIHDALTFRKAALRQRGRAFV